VYLSCRPLCVRNRAVDGKGNLKYKICNGKTDIIIHIINYILNVVKSSVIQSLWSLLTSILYCYRKLSGLNDFKFIFFSQSL